MGISQVKILNIVEHSKKISGKLIPPSDKSITHRSVFLGSLSPNASRIRNPLFSGDCLSTIQCFQSLGVKIQVKANEILIPAGEKSPNSPYRLLKQSKSILDCGNSGTTMRLMSGVLSAQPFVSQLKGDSSLSKRPMKRIIEPLSKMGAQIKAKKDNFAPLTIYGSLNLQPISWKSSVASAQVKSAILLAGLFLEGKTSVSEPELSRDHTERMLSGLGVTLLQRLHPRSRWKYSVELKGMQKLSGLNLTVPSDFSSAAFFIAAALLVPNSNLIIHQVNLNPTRCGLLNVLKRMGAQIKIINKKNIYHEWMGDIQVQTSVLKATQVLKSEIPSLIDEVPILALIATQAKGKTVISGAEELRVKESDRLAAVSQELNRLKSNIIEKKDGLVIEGKTFLVGKQVNSYHDHRIAMTLAIAGLIAQGETHIKNFDCTQISYPNFLKDLKSVIQ